MQNSGTNNSTHTLMSKLTSPTDCAKLSNHILPLLEQRKPWFQKKPKAQNHGVPVFGQARAWPQISDGRYPQESLGHTQQYNTHQRDKRQASAWTRGVGGVLAPCPPPPLGGCSVVQELWGRGVNGHPFRMVAAIDAGLIHHCAKRPSVRAVVLSRPEINSVPSSRARWGRKQEAAPFGGSLQTTPCRSSPSRAPQGIAGWDPVQRGGCTAP